MTENWQAGGFGLYVHWPFCEAKCPYCDFNSHVVANVDQSRWADALVREIRRAGERTPGRVLGSIFFGGGTPSLMVPDTVDAVLRAAEETWTWANDIEISLEANPRSVEAAKFAGFAAAGVNRLSLGVQSLRDPDLRRLGRLHSAAEARDAFTIARQCFSKVSFDLIYARENQSLEEWRAELEEALDLAVDHLSLYQLTIEEGTAFWARRGNGGLAGLPDEDLSADMYELTQDMCAAAGFDGYEISNHARGGAVSRHNLTYWRYGDWVGVGPGAHGRLSFGSARVATEGALAPGQWLSHAMSDSGAVRENQLDPRDIVGEYIMMGMRISEGLDVGRLSDYCDTADMLREIDHLIDEGALWRTGNVVGVTPTARLVLNAVIRRLMPA